LQTSICVPGKLEFLKPTKRTKLIGKHIFQLSKFFVTSVLLQALDIYTDIKTAQTFFNQNHIQWGLCTLFFVILPFIGHLIIYIYGFFTIMIKKREGVIRRTTMKLRLMMHWRKSRQLIWQFPPFNVIR
jgi:hypothetical protein